MEVKVGDVVHLNGISHTTLVVNNVYEEYGKTMCSCFYYNQPTGTFMKIEVSPPALTKVKVQ